MKRREFLHKTAGAVSAATLAGSAPAVLHAAESPRRKKPIIGSGDHRYECDHHWGTLPDHLSWQTTHGVCVDAAGLVYIKHQGYGDDPMDTIVVFDPRGRFVRSFGKEFHKGGHGIDLRKEGGEEYLYLSDFHHHEVVKTSLTGEVVWRMSYPKEAGVYQSVERYRPTNVAFAPDGGFYIGDGYGSHYIHQYDRNAKWVRTWGGEGTEPGKMKTPHGLWLDNRRGRTASLVVADRANARLQYFTLDGKHIGFESNVLFPAHFDIRGDLLLVPDLHARVSLFDRNNKPIVHLGDDPTWIAEVKKFEVRKDATRWIPGKFVHPHDACFDKNGNIFVVEWVETGRVSFLRRV
jgi:hypothetical protein